MSLPIVGRNLTTFALTSSLLFVSALYAATPHPSASLQITSSDSDAFVILTNEARSNITAYQVFVDCGKTAMYSFADSAITVGIHPIPPGGSSRLIAFDERGQPCRERLDAALFADGTSIGDKAVIREILAQRAGTLDAVNHLQPMVWQLALGKADLTSFRRMAKAYERSLPALNLCSNASAGAHQAVKMVLLNVDQLETYPKLVRAGLMLFDLHQIKSRIEGAKPFTM